MLLKGLDSSASDGGQKYGSTKDRPRCGHLRRVPAALAKEIAEKIVGKLNPAGQSVYHISLKGFLHAHPTIKQQVEQLGVHRRTLERAIRAADPDLVKRKVGIRKLLSNHQTTATHHQRACHEEGSIPGPLFGRGHAWRWECWHLQAYGDNGPCPALHGA
jgi:hypothetical protein